MPEPAKQPARVFVSEPITPLGGFQPSRLASGLTSAPQAFEWRGRRFSVRKTRSEAKVSEPEGHREGGERYFRRQEFVVELEDGLTATLYFVRNPTQRRGPGQPRWFLYDIDPAALNDLDDRSV